MSLVWCVIGLFIGFARPEQPAARLAFGAAVTTGLVFSQGAFRQALFSFNPLHVILGVHFFGRFPIDRPLAGAWKWIVLAMYGLAALPITLQWWVRAVRQTRGASDAIELVLSHQSLFALRGPIPLYLFYASLVGMVTLLARNYRVLSDEDQRRRVRWVVFGSIAALVPQIVWSAGEFILGGPGMSWIAVPANVATVGIPLSVAYAVVRHRVFDIRVVVRLGLRYLLARRALQAAVALPAIALVYTVFRHRNLTIVELVTSTRARLDQRIPDLLKECPLCGACFDGDVQRCVHDDRRLTLSLPVARTVEGKYRLERLLGKGGMGAVYEARDLRLDRSVAVKILLGRAFGQQASLRRFRREARAAAQVSHPNIVNVYDVGALEGEGAYIVMELVRGATLRNELEKRRTLDPAAAAEWFGPLLDGPAAPHAHGIIHRDLKPENVIGRREDSGLLTVKILDLGLAKLRGGEGLPSATMTSEGVVMGTLAYMSPEQLLGRDVDHRTDLFAVGVMVVEALTGQRPFSGDGHADLLRAIQQDSYRFPASSPQARAMGELLQRCLAARADDRVASAAALRDELIPLLRSCPPLGELIV